MIPLVSILIPAYNSQEWLPDTIQSALAQTWPRKEIIIVDDGSRDQTLAVARQFLSKEVNVVTQPNLGASVARNKALSISQGEFIQWLDADDLLAPDKIAKQMEVMEGIGSRRTLLSSSWGSFFYRSDRARFSATPLWEDLTPNEWLFRKLDANLFMQTAVWLVSRELALAAGPWDIRLSYDDDGEYFARVIMASDGTKFVPESKVHYRLSGAGSLSYIGRSSRKQDSLLRSMQLHVGYLLSLEGGGRVRSACLKYLQRNLIYFYPERPELVKLLEELAGELGGRLKTPRLPPKYHWIQRAFGWDTAKHAQMFAPRIRRSLVKSWDRVLFHLEGGAQS
jgi:glycosyltransferase involved in cell wall biosynthesis